MSLSQTSLEEAYGGKPFGSRTLVRDSPAEAPQKKVEPKVSISAQIAAGNLIGSLPIDESPPPVTEGFRLREEQPSPVEKRMAIREKFSERPVRGADEDKISRILRLIEQNKTGYERPVVQDMILYVFTGVFFLFTFDTFVMMGKGMRKVKA
jgi:hypothetical protein